MNRSILLLAILGLCLFVYGCHASTRTPATSETSIKFVHLSGEHLGSESFQRLFRGTSVVSLKKKAKAITDFFEKNRAHVYHITELENKVAMKPILKRLRTITGLRYRAYMTRQDGSNPTHKCGIITCLRVDFVHRIDKGSKRSMVAEMHYPNRRERIIVAATHLKAVFAGETETCVANQAEEVSEILTKISEIRKRIGEKSDQVNIPVVVLGDFNAPDKAIDVDLLSESSFDEENKRYSVIDALKTGVSGVTLTNIFASSPEKTAHCGAIDHAFFAVASAIRTPKSPRVVPIKGLTAAPGTCTLTSSALIAAPKKATDHLKALTFTLKFVFRVSRFVETEKVLPIEVQVTSETGLANFVTAIDLSKPRRDTHVQVTEVQATVLSKGFEVLAEIEEGKDEVSN